MNSADSRTVATGAYLVMVAVGIGLMIWLVRRSDAHMRQLVSDARRTATPPPPGGPAE